MIVILILILFYFLLPEPEITGGHVYNENILIIDTLNITHWLFNNNLADFTIESCIKYIVKKCKYDKLYFILKQTEIPISNTKYNTMDEILLKLSIKYKVFIIYIDEKLVDLTQKGNRHAKYSIDDLVCIKVARKYNAKILTNDRMRDFKDFKLIDNYIFYIYNWIKEKKVKEYVTPFYEDLNYHPKIIKPETLF